MESNLELILSKLDKPCDYFGIVLETVLKDCWISYGNPLKLNWNSSGIKSKLLWKQFGAGLEMEFWNYFGRSFCLLSANPKLKILCTLFKNEVKAAMH